MAMGSNINMGGGNWISALITGITNITTTTTKEVTQTKIEEKNWKLRQNLIENQQLDNVFNFGAVNRNNFNPILIVVMVAVAALIILIMIKRSNIQRPSLKISE
jgi:uncharacterized membrane protein YjjP (DUF1212 family)